MSYDIYIGSARMKYTKDMDKDLEVIVDKVEFDKEACLGFEDLIGKSNYICLTYSMAALFANHTGLNYLFFDKEFGLLSFHPGCKAITSEHLDTIRQARLKWETDYPGCQKIIPVKELEPEIFKSILDNYKLDVLDKYDMYYVYLCRFEHLFDWAIKNCEYPAMANR